MPLSKIPIGEFTKLVIFAFKSNHNFEMKTILVSLRMVFFAKFLPLSKKLQHHGFVYLSLLLLVCICTACPYESSVAIDTPKFPIDTNLLGQWKEKDAQNKDFYEIKSLDAYQYSIVENTLNESIEAYQQKEYVGYISQVDGQTFLNLQDKNKMKTYLLFKLDLSTDKKLLTLLPLSEYIREKFANAKDLREFISRNKQFSFFYGKEMLFVRN
jgi:hypothetical protein